MAKIINDSMKSLVAGLGDPTRDKRASVHYANTCLSDADLINAYRTSWLARKIVDIPAKDSVRNGRLWQAEQDQIELIEAEENRLGLWQKLEDVQEKARLFGGAAIYIGTGDEDPSLPLNVEKIKAGGLQYLTVLSRREINAGDIERDALSPFYGKPRYYEVSGSAIQARIHPSRLCIFIGDPFPDSFGAVGPNHGWGDSILQSLYETLKNADATSANIASLVFEANVDVFGVPDLMNSLSDPDYAHRLVERFHLAAAAKGINRSLIRDTAETYDRKQVSFATLPEVMASFLQQVAGASDIPVTRLLGQSPAGMNATGVSDMKNYHDKIAALQKLTIAPAIYALDECLIRSSLGTRPPEVYYTWTPLEQINELEKAQVNKLNAETTAIYVGSGIFTSTEMRQAAFNQLVEDGVYPGIDQIVTESDAPFDLGEDDDQLQPE